MKFIPYGKQNISQADIDAVVKTLESDWLTQGPAITAFEESIAAYCNVPYSAAVMNATAALHLACLGLGVGDQDLVWTSPNTFLASANCARYCGAEVDFVDICPKTYNLSVSALEEKLKIAKQNNRLPKVVIPVHFAGQACDMKAIKELADQYGFKIIEDASHAIGGRYLNEPVGNCRYSDITVFSFHPVKIMTTGEGGVVLTREQSLIDKVKLLRSHGMVRDQNLMTKPSEGDWYYQQIDLGFNYRITDLQCALGLSQLKRLDDFVKRRHEHVAYYNEKLKDLPLILPYTDSRAYSAFHLYVIQIDATKTAHTRKMVFDALRSANIGVNVHYIPIHLQPYYQQFGFKIGDFKEAEHYYSQAISLPMFYSLTREEIDYISEKLHQVLV